MESGESGDCMNKPKDDLISRSAAIEELMGWVDHEHEMIHWTGIKAMLECLPGVEQASHGKWTERRVYPIEDTAIDACQSAKCTSCGKYHTTPYMYYFNDYAYCPNCGARMSGERRDNDVTLD